MQKKNKIKFGIPWEYLRTNTIELLKRAGYEVELNERHYQLKIDDPEIECVSSKVEELAQQVERGLVDIGITETAFILDSQAEVIKIAELNYGYNIWKNAKIILAVPKDSKIKSVNDLEGKKIITWLPEITKNYFKKHKIKVKIEPTNMPAEPKCPAFADAVIEFLNTGAAIKTYNLRILDVIMETSATLIANKMAWQNKWKKEKIDELSALLKGARLGQKIAEAKGTFVLTNPGLKKLDKTDLKIIQALLADGRKSFTEIAQGAGLSSVGTKNRIEKLIKNKLIKIKGLLNIEKFYSMSADIEIEASLAVILRLIKKFEACPLVYSLVRTSKDYNLRISIVVPNLKRVSELVRKQIKSESEVKQTEVNIRELPIVPKAFKPSGFIEKSKKCLCEVKCNECEYFL